jgi:Mrp family chromosome partitioning ATPase
MAALLERCRKEFTFIVIHGPAATYADAFYLAQQSDAVLLCARSGQAKRDVVSRSVGELRHTLPDSTVIGVVLENVPEGERYAHV